MAEEDIFMDYAASSSPIDSEQQQQQQTLKIQLLSVPRIGTNYDEIISERGRISSSLKKFTLNTQETRIKILELRRFNRHLSNVLTEHRKRLNELKDLVDNLNSKLLCQKFEKHHLLDEIKTCLSSKTIFETIELEPLEVDDSYNKDKENYDSHELMIKRLQRELSRRQELQSRLVLILQKKQETELELEKKKRKIEELRSHLQNLIKNSKPLVDACGYDLEDFHKKKMVIDDKIISLSENDKKGEEGEGEKEFDVDVDVDEEIRIIYEKLVSFVSDKPNFKLRYFESESDKNTRDEDEDCELELLGRNSSIKSAYIQIKMEIEEIEPLEIFLKFSDSNLLLKIKHEILPENGILNWLKETETFEATEAPAKTPPPEATENSCWLIPKKFQFDFSQDSESEIFNEIFSNLKEALKIRNRLQNLIQDNFGILEFDKNNPNEIVLLKPMGTSLKAKISMNLINWISEGNEEIDFDYGSCSSSDSDLIAKLNLIGSKYRSIIDCLQAQLELLNKQTN